MRGAEAERDAQCFGQLCERLGELEAVAGLIARQAQPAGDLLLDQGQRRLGADAAVAVQQLVGHAGAFQDRDVLRRAVELLLGAEQLQRAEAALVVSDAGVGAQRAQAVAAVFGQPDHAVLVDLVARRGAVAQHRQAPAPHRRIDLGPDHQRPVAHEGPFERLDRNPRRRPRRGIAGRNLAGIGVAGLQSRARLPVDNRDLMAGLGEVVGQGDADDAAAKNEHFHDRPLVR